MGIKFKSKETKEVKKMNTKKDIKQAKPINFGGW